MIYPHNRIIVSFLHLHKRHLFHIHFDFLYKYLVKLRMGLLKLANKSNEILLKVHFGDDVDNALLDYHTFGT